MKIVHLFRDVFIHVKRVYTFLPEAWHAEDHQNGGSLDQVFIPQLQAGILWSADSLASRKLHQAEAHLRVVPEVGDRRHIRGSVVEGRDAVTLRNSNPILPAYFASWRVSTGPALLLDLVRAINGFRLRGLDLLPCLKQ